MSWCNVLTTYITKILSDDVGHKGLSLKVTLTIDFTMSVVGVATFSSLATMMAVTQNIKTMMTKIISVVVGVALVGRTVPNSVLQDIGSSRKSNLNSGLRVGGSSPPLPTM